MSDKGPFNTLPLQLAAVVLGASLASLRLRHMYHFSLSTTVIVWIGTFIVGSLIVIAATFGAAELSRREKNFYQRTGQKKTE